jgi:hypothetical protein
VEEIMPRRNFRAAVVALALLALSGTAAQAAASRGAVPSLSFSQLFTRLLPHSLRSWSDETRSTARRERPMPRKCSAGIDPNGKPCP